MLAKLFKARKIKNKDYGVFAKQFIPKGTVVFIFCDKCKKIPKNEFAKLDKKEQLGLLVHAFTDENGDVWLECDQGKYINHCCDTNLVDHKNISLAARDIKKGEEISYDYRIFNDEEHIGDHGFKCFCGAKNCCKEFKNQNPSKELKKQWKLLEKNALKAAKKIDQPMKKYLEKYGVKL